jgi:hypothetical protein
VTRGVYAGRNYSRGDIIESAATVSLRTDVAHATSVINYVFSTSHDDYVFVVLGAGMLFNHDSNPNVEHSWVDSAHNIDPSETVENPNSYFYDVNFIASRDINAGEELFVNYGPDGEWFKSRGIELAKIDSTRAILAVEHLNKVGVCQGSNFVNSSTIYGAGRGLFAGKDYKVGDTIIISPTLLLPNDYISDPYANTNFQNYLISYPGSNLGIFPIGQGSLINHFAAVTGGDKLENGAEPNVKLQWHPWYGEQDMENYANEVPLQSLMNSFAAPLDVAYIATQPIAKGEEILMDYGEMWVELWGIYLKELSEKDCHFSNAWSCENPPAFKSAIYEPNLYFPHSWRSYNCTDNEDKEKF